MNVRSPLIPTLVFVFTSTAGSALAMPPAAAAPAAAHAPTPPNPDKTLRPQTPAVAKTPTVGLHTAVLAEKHDQLKQDPSKPVPAKLRLAKQEVLERDQTVAVSRTQFHTESDAISAKATALRNPTRAETYLRYNPAARGGSENYVKRVAVDPTSDQLAQASEGYVSAAQLLVSKSGNLSQRVARENPDPGAKVTAAKAMADDYRKGAALYRSSADTEEQRAAVLTKAGKLPEAQTAHDKAQNTRVVAASFEKRATEIEVKGVPGADAYTLPNELRLSSGK